VRQKTGLELRSEEIFKGLTDSLSQDGKAALQVRDSAAHFVLNQLEGRAALRREKARRFDKEAAEIEALASSFRFGIQMWMERDGLKEVKGKKHSFKLKKNPKGVLIDNEAEIPGEFVEFESSVNKKAIGEALRKGQAVPGAKLKEETNRVEIT
jgi:hypothetical protein